MSRTPKQIIMTILAVTAVVVFPDFTLANNKLSGTFVGEGITLKVAPNDAGYSGDIIRGETEFPFTAMMDGKNLSGHFVHQKSRFAFTARLSENTLIFATGSREYTLKRVTPKVANPLASPATPKPDNPLAVDKPEPTEKPRVPVNPLIGRWTDGIEEYQFTNDHVIVIDVEEPTDRLKGGYRVNGDKLTLTIDGDTDTVRFKVTATTLAVTDSFGETEVFKRIGPAPSPKTHVPGRDTTTLKRTGWAGEYRGTIKGTPTQVTVKLDRTTLTGTIDASGYVYELNGTVKGQTASGSCRDTRTRGNLRFEAKLEGNVMSMTLITQNPQTGQVVRLPFQFTRSGVGATPKPTKQTATDKNVERDRAIVGRWRYTWTQSSGGFSAAGDVWMLINADGTYRYGDSKAAGGGDAGSVVSEGGNSDVSIGTWRTQNKIIYGKERGSSAWEAVGRYYVEGNKMMVTYADGSKKIWYRQ